MGVAVMGVAVMGVAAKGLAVTGWSGRPLREEHRSGAV